MRRTVDIGFLFSTDGTYRHMGRNGLLGAQHALAEVNASEVFDFTLRATHVDPQGHLQGYGEGATQLIDKGVRHIFGTTTSASRKEIIPDLEQHASTLWYACPYEGFESSENVLYFGGCPNQTLIPLLRYALATFGKRALLVGSNYVWGWESNRIAREVITLAGGEVLKEKYMHLGATHVAELVQAVVGEPPAFILNNLVGDSSYAFLHQLDAACLAAGLQLPVLSSNLTEAELSEIGSLSSLRLLSCGPFFEAADLAFCQQQTARHGQHVYSHFYAGSYSAVQLFAQALQHCGSDDSAAICGYLHQHPQPSVLGELRISPRNNHSSLACHIAELQQGRFVILHSEPQAVPADPYMTATDLTEFRQLSAPTPRLRIVK